VIKVDNKHKLKKPNQTKQNLSKTPMRQMVLLKCINAVFRYSFFGSVVL